MSDEAVAAVAGERPRAAGSSRGGPSCPSVSVVVAVYQAEPWIGACLDSILGQSHPPDEVVVIDDGSTDGSARELARYGDRIRVIRQENRGYQASINRAIREATSAFVALCGADDIWEPRKLEWQLASATKHPEADIFFGHAVFFGRAAGDHPRPTGRGVLDGDQLRRDLFRVQVLNTPSVLIRRALFDRLGPFVETFPDEPGRSFPADDYEFWFRCLRAGVRFHYDERLLVHYRQHGSSITAAHMNVHHAMSLVRRSYASDLADPALVREVLAPAEFRVGRGYVDAGRATEARRAFARSLRYGRGNLAATNLRALVWLGILSLPAGVRGRVGPALLGAARALDTARGGRSAALP
jgi:glycosyltransferase involved in cell wall biosynthesis